MDPTQLTLQDTAERKVTFIDARHSSLIIDYFTWLRQWPQKYPCTILVLHNAQCIVTPLQQCGKDTFLPTASWLSSSSKGYRRDLTLDLTMPLLFVFSQPN